MSDFSLWFKTGVLHITDWQGYDHMLFLLITMGVFIWRDIKTVLTNITGFTVGHSITLILSTLEFIHYSSELIEILIPTTIAISAILQLFTLNKIPSKNDQTIQFSIILIFGLIHGMGFSTLLKSMLGKEESIVQPLLAFNLGIEFGQILIVSILLTISTLCLKIWHIQSRDFKLFIAAFVLSLSLKMIIERIPAERNDSEKSCEIPQKLPTFVNTQYLNINKFSLHA